MPKTHNRKVYHMVNLEENPIIYSLSCFVFLTNKIHIKNQNLRSLKREERENNE